MWSLARAAVMMMQMAGVEFSVLGDHELCCGGRAYEMGYREDFLQAANLYLERIKKRGAKAIVTGCSDCYHAFKVIYDRFNLKGDLEVFHVTELLSRLIRAGKIKYKKKVFTSVTYQDPCNLGRKGEPYIHWKGRELPGHRRLFDPPKEFRRGTYGVYQPPREVIESIPGVKFLEMHRTREYAWCCGAGGGVKEFNPDFAAWTAKERILEAEDTGAEALITACPGCKRSFLDAIKACESHLKIYDVAEFLFQAV